jgi:hypothetical protein
VDFKQDASSFRVTPSTTMEVRRREIRLLLLTPL